MKITRHGTVFADACNGKTIITLEHDTCSPTHRIKLEGDDGVIVLTLSTPQTELIYDNVLGTNHKGEYLGGYPR